MSMKIPMTSSGKEPATFRFVAQNPNHRAIAVPSKKVVRHEFNGWYVLFCINDVNLRLQKTMPLNMAAWWSCNNFGNAAFKNSALPNWALGQSSVQMRATQTEPKHKFVTQATTVLLPTILINRQCANFPKSWISFEIQGVRGVT